MEMVNNVHDCRWVDDDTPGARGYKYIEIVPDGSDHTDTFSCELIHLGPGDESLTHVEPYNHLLFFVKGSGEVTIGDRTWPLSPGSYARSWPARSTRSGTSGTPRC
jgi:quercetin dioxygenase-like cupin family protein